MACWSLLVKCSVKCSDQRFSVYPSFARILGVGYDFEHRGIDLGTNEPHKLHKEFHSNHQLHILDKLKAGPLYQCAIFGRL